MVVDPNVLLYFWDSWSGSLRGVLLLGWGSTFGAGVYCSVELAWGDWGGYRHNAGSTEH